MRQVIINIALCLVFTAALAQAAPPTAAQRKDLNDIRSDATKVGAMTARKKFDEAEEALSEVTARFDKLVKEAELSDTDVLVKTVKKAIETQRALLDKATGKGGGGVSFAEDVAPILADNCLGCHGANNPRNGLRLDTFAGMEAGGRSGRLLTPGNPAPSLLMQKLAALNPQFRMPKDGERLTDEQLQMIGKWIAAGAPFDGTEKNVSLALLAKNPALAREKIEIVRATGDEKVSFVKDIAPTFVNTCGNCHGNNNPRGGLSLATFERVMAGGEGGRVIVPGNVADSRMFQLLADGTMPQGNQARITRKWYADLQTWIKEGAKYDGGDPKRPLRDLIPTPEQLQAEKLAKLTPEDWLEKRRKESKDLWLQTFPKGEPQPHETADFIVMGDVAAKRLEEIGGWAQEHAAALRTMFNVKDEPLFKGKLAIFVFKDRFGYEEFNSTIHRREVPREVAGHSDVTAAQDRAFAALQDIGDDASPNSPGMQLNVVEHVTGAFLKRSGTGGMPDWLIRGTGLALAAGKSAAGSPYVSALRGQAGDALRKSNFNDPGDVFQDGQFSPADVGPIGYVLVDFLIRRAGAGAFGKLVQRFQSGDTPAQAIQAVYATGPRQLGSAFLQTAGLATSGTKKKKAN